MPGVDSECQEWWTDSNSGVGATGTNLTMQIVWGGWGVTGGTFSNVQLEAENVHNLPGELHCSTRWQRRSISWVRFAKLDSNTTTTLK